MTKLPRPATFPSLLSKMGGRGRSPGVSPTRKGSFNGTFQCGNAASGKRAGDACNAGSKILSFFSKCFLAAMAMLYLVACTALPEIMGSTHSSGATLSRHRRGEVASASSYHSAALTAFRNRRMALERSVITQPRSLNTGLPDPVDFDQEVMVNYREEGLKVPLLLALNASHWNEFPIYETGKQNVCAFRMQRSPHYTIIDHILRKYAI